MILAYAYSLRLLLAAGLVCLIVFCADALTSVSGMWWTGFWGRSETILVAGVLIAVVPILTPRMPKAFAGGKPVAKGHIVDILD